MSKRRPAIIGHHLIWTLYGHWLANDPRGSGSEDLREEKFSDLGPIHHGRKPETQQPSKQELRDYYREANPRLDHRKFWLGAKTRSVLGCVLGEVIAKQNYTVWACAVLSNHMHIVIRRHRDDALTMWHQFADASRLRLREEASLSPNHPVWSTRPYKVFLRTPHEVWTRVRYVEKNPQKEGLSAQHYDFVQTYNNWPFHKPK